MHIDLNSYIDNAKVHARILRHELAMQVRDFSIAYHRHILFVLGLAAGYWMIGPAVFGK